MKHNTKACRPASVKLPRAMDGGTVMMGTYSVGEEYV
jgi:hypothetical protein